MASPWAEEYHGYAKGMGNGIKKKYKSSAKHMSGEEEDSCGFSHHSQMALSSELLSIPSTSTWQHGTTEKCEWEPTYCLESAWCSLEPEDFSNFIF